MANSQIDTNTRPDLERRSIVMSLRFRQNGYNPKVVQLRHALYQITEKPYDSAMSVEKREAHSGVIRPVRPVPGRVMVKSQVPDSSASPSSSPA
jgi:hypothetical protein